jgi:hypothetical protein
VAETFLLERRWKSGEIVGNRAPRELTEGSHQGKAVGCWRLAVGGWLFAVSLREADNPDNPYNPYNNYNPYNPLVSGHALTTLTTLTTFFRHKGTKTQRITKISLFFRDHQ